MTGLPKSCSDDKFMHSLVCSSLACLSMGRIRNPKLIFTLHQSFTSFSTQDDTFTKEQKILPLDDDVMPPCV